MINWRWRKFDELTVHELYDVLQLREAVFQVEQQCAYQDCDGVDQTSEHLLGYQDNKLVAYLRIYTIKNSLHIGRILTTKIARGKGLGREMIQECLNYIKRHHPNAPVEMSAQIY